jgi:hypothetical protein
LEKIFDFVRPLVTEDVDSDDGDLEKFEQEQNAVARISHMIYNENTDQFFSFVLLPFI